MKYKVMIAKFPGNESEHPGSSGYITKLYHQLMTQDDISAVVPWRMSDTPITMSRNRCVKDALDNKVDYLLMIDSDVEPDYLVGVDPTARPFWDSSWEFLMRRRRSESNSGGFEIYRQKDLNPCCIAAPYCGKPPFENIFVFLWRNFESNSPTPNFKLDQFTREEAAQRGGIEEVGALPTGLILYDMRIFQPGALPPPWFEYEYADPPFNTRKSTTEDVYQTRNQSMLKMPCFVNWDSWAIHHKPKAVGKPITIKVDQVHKSLVDAVQLGHRAGEQLRYVDFFEGQIDESAHS